MRLCFLNLRYSESSGRKNKKSRHHFIVNYRQLEARSFVCSFVNRISGNLKQLRKVKIIIVHKYNYCICIACDFIVTFETSFININEIK